MEINQLITNKETNAFRFKPNMAFFKEIGINRKRFYMILKKETDPTLSELRTISKYFDVNITELVS
jgi:hypothetical protein